MRKVPPHRMQNKWQRELSTFGCRVWIPESDFWVQIPCSLARKPQLVNTDPQSWWGRAHILLRAQSHLPGRVTREVCLPARSAGGILWVWSRLEVLLSYFSPTLAGGVDPTAPPSPVSPTFNRPFRPPEQWRVFRSTFSACDLRFF